MNVADDVERAVLLFAVVPERLPFDDGCIHFFHGRKNEDVAESFAFQSAQRAAQLLRLIAHDVRTEVTVRAALIAIVAETLRQIQHDSHWKHVIVAREINQRFACFRLNIGGVDNRQLGRRQSFACDEVQDFKGVVGGGLVVFVVGNKAAAEIRRENFRGLEMFTGER